METTGQIISNRAILVLVIVAIAGLSVAGILKIAHGHQLAQARNVPPQVNITNPPQHMFVKGQLQICADYSDRDSSSLFAAWTSSRKGFRPIRHVSAMPDCILFTAPAKPGWEKLKITVTDGIQPVSYTAKFWVNKDLFPG